MRINNHFEFSGKQLITASSFLILAGVVFFPPTVGWLVVELLLPIILLGYHHRQRLLVSQQAALVGLSLAIILFTSVDCLRVVRKNISQPPEYDFSGFWLSGRVAAQGLNFYEPKFYYEMARPLNPSKEFTDEILSVGFWYPPPSIFLFVPLGWFEIHAAILLWYIVNIGILILTILLLWKIFLSHDGLIGFLLVVTLVLMLPSTILTIHFAQTNFIVLLMLLLFWRDRTRFRGGIWLALGIITKPFMAILLIYLLVRRKWRGVVGAFIALAAASTMSILAFGSATFLSYFISNPATRLPSWYFAELNNGSLYAFLWRMSAAYLGDTALAQPVFLMTSIILVGLTIWLVYRLIPSYDEWALAITLSMALLLYPNTGSPYCTTLMAPILLLWKHRQKFFLNIRWIGAFITLLFWFLGYHVGWSNFVFVAIALNWLVFFALGVWLLKQHTHLDFFQAKHSI